MVLDTRVTRLLGIEHPIIQGGMHYVGYAVLAAAVSNAGGLGTVTALTQKSPEDLRAEIRRVRALTSKPFAVNLTLLPSLAPPDYGAYARVIVEEKVPVVETAGRNPAEWITFFKKTRNTRDTQVRRDQTRADRREARRGLHKHGRVRVRGAPRRGRRRELCAARQGGEEVDDPVRRERRRRHREPARGGARARRGGRELRHAVHGDDRGAHPRRNQARAREGRRAEHDARDAERREHGARV
mmetsp:Transcript_12182/g.43846  ORF Transcript_12182/g.43846 Transcript_12182/m.43846 type:complete len:242 (+) Transcript_12182:133-858(+)